MLLPGVHVTAYISTIECSCNTERVCFNWKWKSSCTHLVMLIRHTCVDSVYGVLVHEFWSCALQHSGSCSWWPMSVLRQPQAKLKYMKKEFVSKHVWRVDLHVLIHEAVNIIISRLRLPVVRWNVKRPSKPQHTLHTVLAVKKQPQHCSLFVQPQFSHAHIPQTSPVYWCAGHACTFG